MPESSVCKGGTPEATKLKGSQTASSCLAPRPRFFRGELVTDLDLTAVVDYHRAQQLLSNDVIGGWGVYCGYSLHVDGTNCCIRVGPGVAYDARGRALVNPKTVCIGRPSIGDLAKPRDPCDRDSPPPRTTLWLAVAYDDCLDVAKPRYSTPCGTSSDPGCDFTRIRERARFVWLTDEPPSDYWITGCLGDPCAADEQTDPNCPTTDPDFETEEPRLDICTPDVGIRGGVGVSAYEWALVQHWNLTRNYDLLKKHAEGDIPKCETGPGSLIDVISGVSCAPCCGEAFVLLACVVWDADECDVPKIDVLPLKRRVLSNADLTYLMIWLLERLICGDHGTQAQLEEELPPSSVSCVPGDEPCVEDQARELGKIIAGPAADRMQMMQAVASVLYQRRIEGVPLARLYDFEQMRDIQAIMLGRAPNEDELEELRTRRERAMSRSKRERDVKSAVELIYQNQRLQPSEYDRAADIIDGALHAHGVAELLAIPREVRHTIVDRLREGIEAIIPQGILERLGLADEESPRVPAEDVEILAELISQRPEIADALAKVKAGRKKPKKPKS